MKGTYKLVWVGSKDGAMKKDTPLVPLTEICEINPKSVNNFQPNTKITFVPMAAVDEKTARIQNPEVRTYQEVAKGFTVFKENDVLFAKITPCMENGKCAIARNLLNGWGFGSTEFHILRTSDKIIPEWIFYFLRQEKIRHFAASNMTGTAGQQRVPKSFFEKVRISLPPLPIQKKIAAILEKADAAREKRRQANQLTKQFLQSAFLEMFGDPVMNPNNYKIHYLENLCHKITDGEHINPKLQPHGKYLIMAKDVREDRIDFSQNHFVSEDDYIKFTRRCNPTKGDIVLVSRGATIGRCTTIKSSTSFCLMGSVILIKPRDAVARFLEYLFKNFKFIKNLLNLSPSSAQQAIYLQNLKKLKIPVPSIEMQNKFTALVEKVDSLRARQRQSEQELENLFNILMQRAFRGEL